LIQLLHFQIFQVPVYVYNDGDAYGCFARGYGNGKQREEKALQLPGKQIAVEDCEVDIDGIQDKFYRNQYRQQVAPRDEAVNSGKKHDGANHQKIFHFHFLLF
jgi:hypothetical protein